MAKDKLTDYDSTASGNLDVGGISVAEGMLPSGVNNAIRELMSHQADAFGAGTPLYVDQTNNRVGINQAAPAHPLHVGTDDLIVDASGNLLVGKTSVSTSTAGFEVRSDGLIYSGRDGNEPLILNRLTSDGDIASFRINGTTVGSIGTGNSNRPYIGSGDTAIMFDATNNAIYPWNITAASPPASDQVDLGYDATGLKFKDLYLGGGVYLGGTGSAHLLDDYEEGTFTAFIYGTTSGTGVNVPTTADYIKVGNHCTISAYFSNVNLSSMSGSVKVGGLPFTSTSSSVGLYTGSLISYGFSFSGFLTSYISSGQTSLDILDSVSGSSWQALAIPASTGKYMIIGCTYRTA